MEMSVGKGDSALKEYLEGLQDLSESPFIIEKIISLEDKEKENPTPLPSRPSLLSLLLQIDIFSKQIKSTLYNEEASKVLFEMTKDPSISLARTVEIMLYGAKPTWSCPVSKKNAMHHLAAAGNYKVLKFLCRFQAFPVSGRDKNMQTPLILACKATPSTSNAKTIYHLLKRRDACIDELDICGYNALYYAWEKKNMSAVRMLLQRKASVMICLKELAEEIRVLYEVSKLLDLHTGKNIVELTALPKPESLQSFFSATSLHPLMVDFYSSIRVQWAAMRCGSRYTVDGMVMMGLREEMRAMKKHASNQAIIQNTHIADITLDIRENDTEGYNESVEMSKSRRLEVKQMKLRRLKEKKEEGEKVAIEVERKQQSERIDQLFNTKIPLKKGGPVYVF